MSLKSLNRRKLSIVLVALSAPFLGLWYWNSGAQARFWNDVQRKRYQALKFRHLPALSTFFEKNLGNSVKTTYEVTMASPNGDNLAWSHGSLVSNWELAGTFQLTFTYQGDSINPSSMQMRATLVPEFLNTLPQSELRFLADRTRKEGAVSDTFCGQRWFSFFEKKGQLNVTLRMAFPNPWIADRPEYDRGFTDEMYYRIGPTAIRYLRKEVFVEKEYVRIELEAPDTGTPGYVRRDPLGSISGFVFPNEGPPIHLEISTSTSSRKRSPDLGISLFVESRRLPVVHSKSLIKPEFLKKVGQEIGNEPRVSGATENGIAIFISGDLNDFDKWAPSQDILD